MRVTGSYIPFRATKAERLAAADPRLSLEGRYPAKGSHAFAVESAANTLVKQGYFIAGGRSPAHPGGEAIGCRPRPIALRTL